MRYFAIAPFASAALLGGCALVTDYEYRPAAGDGDPVASGGSGADGGHSNASGALAGGGGHGGTPPDCLGGEVCVAAAPSDWEGPVAMYSGQEPAPECAPGWTATDAFAGNVAGSITCTTCGCAGPSGGGCGVPTLDLFSSAGCGDKYGEYTLQANTCMWVGHLVVKPGPVPVIPGSCTASGGVESKTAVSWDAQGRLCGPTRSAADCAGGGSCRTDPPAGFRWPCISRAGTHACPSGFDASTETLYLDVDDTRACSACTCSVEGAACSGTLTKYTDSDCDDNASTSGPGACYSYSAGALEYVPGTTTLGSCAAAGGQPMGGVAGGSPVTVCCGDPPST